MMLAGGPPLYESREQWDRMFADHVRFADDRRLTRCGHCVFWRQEHDTHGACLRSFGSLMMEDGGTSSIKYLSTHDQVCDGFQYNAVRDSSVADTEGQ